jgi:hypothetical protein
MKQNNTKITEEPVAVEEITEELVAAEREAEKSEGTVSLTLKKPVLYNGKEFKSLEFDFESLTGRDALAIEAELERTLGRPVIIPQFSGEYLIRMAARACTEKIGTDIFENMCLADYNRIRSAARSFLLSSEL